MSTTMHLTEGWQWREAAPNEDIQETAISDDDKPDWRNATQFPSEVHVELKAAGLISDPYIGFNEHGVQWVGERVWLYNCRFLSPARDDEPFIALKFEGLDTFCDVYLNGVKVLEGDNMFRTYWVPVARSALVPGGTNTLLLHFKSAKLIAKDLERTYGKVRAGSTNLGDPSRVYVRKAQYDWRWDWGPELMTCGPYRPISLISYTTRISTAFPQATVRQDGDGAPHVSLSLDLTLTGKWIEAGTVQCALRARGSSEITFAESVGLVSNTSYNSDVRDPERNLQKLLNWELTDKVKLWWPTGYGEQALYDLEIVLLSTSNEVLDQVTRRVGFRLIRLVQEPLLEADWYGKGTTFLFEVNGVRMFMGGSNWIPADNFLTTITADRYRRWLTLLRDGNQNMVRLWGGGVYEPDVFYDICDELGILVWQDFQFACGVYPAHPQFLESVRREAEDVVERLRHHPSLALLCGNNEDYQQVLQWGDVKELPARIIYEDVLPDVVQSLTSPPIPYHRGSPYGGQGWDTADPTVGDVHQWDIWGGKERPWQDYGIMGGRFVSEFGIPAMPDVRTIDYWLDGNVKERWAQSKLMAQHNRAGGHERRFAIVMNENFRLTGDFETHVYNTQMMQSEAVSLAYRMWRREWRGRGKEYCAGALVWQLNDCWPVTSWSLVDYFLRPKPVYYTVARELAKYSVGMFRTVEKNRPNDRPVQFYEFGAFQSTSATIDIWGTNGTLEPQHAQLELSCFDLLSPWTHQETHAVVLEANQSTDLLHMNCPCPPAAAESPNAATSTTTSFSVVVHARLVDSSGVVLARYSDWPQPFRHCEFPDPEVSLLAQREDWGERITVSVVRPVKGLCLAVPNDGPEVKWSDNCLDIVPGDPHTVMRTGPPIENELKVSYMGMEKGVMVAVGLRKGISHEKIFV